MGGRQLFVMLTPMSLSSPLCRAKLLSAQCHLPVPSTWTRTDNTNAHQISHALRLGVVLLSCVATGLDPARHKAAFSNGTAPLNTPSHIAIVDDEKDITTLLSAYLSGHGFRVTALQSGRALMDLMRTDPPALVLLDLGLPGEDGFVIARQLREHWRCGLVIVTGRGDAVDKVVGLEVGADDYVTKPFDMRELLARVKAVLRRLTPQAAVPLAALAQTGDSEPATASVASSSGTAEHFSFAGWQLNTAARSLTDATGSDAALTGGEFSLLCAFVRHPGRVLSRDFLMEQTHGREAGPFDRTVDVQVGRLRKKLEVAPDDPQIIKSVRSAGYIFVPVVTSAG
jgi:two-component system, OmpR family, response regulator